MFESPAAEHAWFAPLVGRWTSEGECQMGPDQPPMKSTSQVEARSLGGMWITLETTGGDPDGGTYTSLMTLGFSLARQRYTGTFVGSMGSYLWIYDGSVSADGKRLVLDTVGPRFDAEGTTQYQDIIEIVDQDHWILSSQLRSEDGQWIPFMTAHHRRNA